uniref:Glycerate kinase n=1 Tax=Riptortus pedestris TaxID=329032 RepID=R4WJW7_RIPPE|nr:glycerate kinase [Riptortus pedestris]
MLNCETKHFLRLIFKSMVQSVKPRELIRSQIKVFGNTLIIHDQKFNIKQNCYITGFGKAVYEMGCEVDNLLKDHIRKGIFIVPEGSIGAENHHLTDKSNYKVFQGARDNIPDMNSYHATEEVMKLIETLTHDDLLLVLISGGGSALLSCPTQPLNLTEKINITKLLARSGADIKELNTVRKQLSAVKGGRLAQLAYPCQVISLILSDVIDDPIDMIASGPTVKNEDKPGSGLKILEKYSLLDQVSNDVIKVLSEYTDNIEPVVFERNQTFILGNNSKALYSGKEFIEENNKKCCVLSTNVEGSVENVSEELAKLTQIVIEQLKNGIPIVKYKESYSDLIEHLCIKKEKLNELDDILTSGVKELFLILGGETTVTVKGKGKGGRNMELALRFSQKIHNILQSSHLSEGISVGLLCAGTDGIDGPTDSAGAIAYYGQEDEAKKQGLNTAAYISNNDSYNFFRNYNNGQDLIVTGHTGTNVMDVIILYIKAVQ